jgi:hypothetical protein
MDSNVYKELDNLCKDFMNLAPDLKKRILMDAESLLKIQRQSRALIESSNILPTKEKEYEGAGNGK